MMISRQNLTLAALAGCLLCLLTNCVQADREKLDRLNSLRMQSASLDKALSDTRRDISVKNGQNKRHLEEMAANLKNAEAIRKRSEKFWRNHQAVFLENEHKDILADQGFGGRIWFGTPARVFANSTQTNWNIHWMAICTERKALAYDKIVPLTDAKTDIRNDRACVVVQEGATQMLPFAEMKVLVGPERGPCVLMDHALGPMTENCRLDGFELLLETDKDGKIPYIGKLALVVMTEKDKAGGMIIQDEQKIDLELDKDICKRKFLGDDQCLLQVSFGDKYGSLPIWKGQFWGICVPKDAKISCEYLGLPAGNEIFFPGGGGDVWVAEWEGKELKFNRPIPRTIPRQGYFATGCVYNEAALKDNSIWEDKIRKTLRPTITMAVYGTLAMDGRQ